MMLNRYPSWKYIVLAIVLALGVIYSVPNLYGEDPAVQVLPGTGRTLNAQVKSQIEAALNNANIAYRSIQLEGNTFLIRLADPTLQISAKDAIRQALDENYIVALNLAPRTPAWLEMLGAKPMKLGLDLRGGVHFLIEVDTDSAITRRMEGVMSDMRTELRQENIRYRGMNRSNPNEIAIGFDTQEGLNEAYQHFQKQF